MAIGDGQNRRKHGDWISSETGPSLKEYHEIMKGLNLKPESSLQLEPMEKATEETGNPILEPAYGFLEEASGVLRARAELRDSPKGERTASQIAEVFNALTNHKLTEADAWIFLLVLKLVRSRNGKYCRDDYVDLASYASLLGESESKNR